MYLDVPCACLCVRQAKGGFVSVLSNRTKMKTAMGVLCSAKEEGGLALSPGDVIQALNNVCVRAWHLCEPCVGV